MKRSFLSLAAVLLLTSSSFAAPVTETVRIRDLGNVLDGYRPINGTTFGRKDAGTDTRDLPDTTIPAGYDNHGGSSEPHIGNPNPTGKGWFNEKCGGVAEYNDDCTVLSMNPGHGATIIPAQFIDGGTTVVPTCTASTKTIGNVNIFRGTASVTSDSSTSDGAC